MKSLPTYFWWRYYSGFYLITFGYLPYQPPGNPRNHALANLIGILFAFLTNDTIVFKQERRNWSTRLAKFS